MKQERYNFIFTSMKTRDDLLQLAFICPDVSYNTLLCIYGQKYQDLMRRTLPTHRKPENMAVYFKRYISGENILSISQSINISPCLISRMIIELQLIDQDPDLSTSQIKSEVTKCIKDTSFIEDKRLRWEVDQCIKYDDNYSPLVERVRHMIGVEYEQQLNLKLSELGIPFKTESEMRKLGMPKTPDVKLEVPIVVSGNVINWIESKASFGDEYTHKLYLQEQFWGYCNRYGPGLVIYWFGFIDELDIFKDKGIMLIDHFPKNINTLFNMNEDSNLKTIEKSSNF